MIIDTSAILSILLLETAIVLEGRYETGAA